MVSGQACIGWAPALLHSPRRPPADKRFACYLPVGERFNLRGLSEKQTYAAVLRLSLLKRSLCTRVIATAEVIGSAVAFWTQFFYPKRCWGRFLSVRK